MTAQLLLTMTSDFAAQVSRSRKRVNGQALLKGLRTAKLIGPPGFSMRVSVDESELPALRKQLGSKFVIEPDYVLETFGPRPRRPSAISAAT